MQEAARKTAVRWRFPERKPPLSFDEKPNSILVCSLYAAAQLLCVLPLPSARRPEGSIESQGFSKTVSTQIDMALRYVWKTEYSTQCDFKIEKRPLIFKALRRFFTLFRWIKSMRWGIL